MKFGFEGREKYAHTVESKEKNELCEHARETFDMHVQNLERFELEFSEQKDSLEYSFLRNKLLREIYESGKLMEEVEGQQG